MFLEGWKIGKVFGLGTLGMEEGFGGFEWVIGGCEGFG